MFKRLSFIQHKRFVPDTLLTMVTAKLGTRVFKKSPTFYTR